MKNILLAKEFTKDTLDRILSSAARIEEDLKNGKLEKTLRDKIIACIFFEPSTRTRLSFESASMRLGASVISSENAAANSSSYKGETLEDSIKIISGYADLIVLRHPESGSAERAAKVSKVPVINAGDGSREHPTQGILDLYTIKKELGRLDNLKIAFVGDLIYGRTLHSLVPFLSQYKNNKFFFISPRELSLSEGYKEELLDKKIQFEESQNMEEALKTADVVYMTRVQKERFHSTEEYDRVKDSFLLNPEHLKLMKKDAIIMHPLPRINEIPQKIDNDPRAAYFREAQNGLYARMALLLYAFEE